MIISWHFINKLTIFVIILQTSQKVLAQDYEVSDINCSFGEVSVETNSRIKQLLSAVLKRPEDFQGSPIFADDRGINPLTDSECQIRPLDEEGQTYRLLINDLDKCGILVKNGFINVRVWFPKLPGVVMMSDQEVIIMCKPPERVVTQNKAAGFAGALPPAARVSGVVQESPGTLEYEVALYREASPRSIEDGGDGLTVALQNEIPVDQAVPIGTKLQLRATINNESAWKFVRLQEVTISTSKSSAYAPGHITLVENGCRKDEFATIVPRQPYRPELLPNEVRLEFEAVLLDVNKDRKNQLWIHAKIKACVTKKDCEAEFCLDLYQPSGMGRRRKRTRKSRNADDEGHLGFFYPVTPSVKQRRNNSRVLNDPKENFGTATNINDNVGVTVIMPPDEYYTNPDGTTTTHRSVSRQEINSNVDQKLFAKNKKDDCQIFIVIGCILGCLIIAASLLMCILSARLMKLTREYKREKLEGVVREHRMKFGNQQKGPVMGGDGRPPELFSTSGNSNFLTPR